MYNSRWYLTGRVEVQPQKSKNRYDIGYTLCDGCLDCMCRPKPGTAGSFAGGVLATVLRPEAVGTSYLVSVAALTVWNHLKKCGTS
jgi:hypothetical protein